MLEYVGRKIALLILMQMLTTHFATKKQLKGIDKNQKGTERREGKERMKVNKREKRRPKKRESM
jgi:hypothetical protein